MAEITRWVESGGVDSVGGAVLENTALSGLNPRDIRPVVRDLENGEDMLVDSGSVV